MCEYIVKVIQRTQQSHSQSDVKPFIYLHTKWLEDVTEFQLHLTTNNTSYKASLKHDEIRLAAEDLEQPFKEFFEECKIALTTNMGSPGFDYELDDDKLEFKLWKCTGFETLFVKLELRVVSTCHQLLDAAIECAQQRATTVGPSNSQVEEKSRDYQEMATEYDNYIDELNKREKKMLKRFLLLLNSKKERIGKLEEQLKRRKLVTEETDSDVDQEADESSDDEDFAGATQALTQPENIQD